MHTVMAVDVLGVNSVVWNHPCLSGSIVLFFITSLFHLVIFFSPLLISTALCVISLISIGPQIEKIREERERQFKLVGLGLQGAENERPFNRYLVFRRGKRRPPRGRGRGERWSDWVRGVEIRGQSIWLSDSQFMTDIEEENLKADFRDGEGGIKMIEEDTCPGGALAFASVADSLLDLSGFHNLVPTFCPEMYDSPVIQRFSESIERFEHAKSSVSVCEFQGQTKISIAGFNVAGSPAADMMICEGNDIAGHRVVFDATDKNRRVLKKERAGKDFREPVLCSNVLKADRIHYTPSTKASLQGDATDVRFGSIADEASVPEVCTALVQNLKKACEKQNKPSVNVEPSGRSKHNKSVSLITEKDSVSSTSRCGCFNKQKFPCLFKTPPDTRLKHIDHNASV